MSDRTWPIRFALYGFASFVSGAGDGWLLALTLFLVAGLLGLALEYRLRSFFNPRPLVFFATLALLSSVPTLPSHLLMFSVGCAGFFALTRRKSPGVGSLVLTAALAVTPTVYLWTQASSWNVSLENLLVGLFGSSGLLYGAPLLWGGFVGLIALKRDHRGLFRIVAVALVSGTLSLLLDFDHGDSSARTLTWLPFLLPGLAQCFERARTFAMRRPDRVLVLGGALLIAWNVLFMEQYRRRLLPSDDTVSFAQVTSNSASLVAARVGTPFAWPANWLFAARFHAPVAQWDAVAGPSLFASSTTVRATIEIGDDASVFAADTALLLEGFGTRRTCEQGWCRDLDGAARILLPLRDVGQGEFAIVVRARGEGTLTLTLNEAQTAAAELSDKLSDVTLRVPARLIKPGINVLSLKASGGGKTTLDRLTLERDLSSGSATTRRE